MTGASEDGIVKGILHARLYVRLCGASPNDHEDPGYTDLSSIRSYRICEGCRLPYGGASIRMTGLCQCWLDTEFSRPRTLGCLSWQADFAAGGGCWS